MQPPTSVPDVSHLAERFAADAGLEPAPALRAVSAALARGWRLHPPAAAAPPGDPAAAELLGRLAAAGPGEGLALWWQREPGAWAAAPDAYALAAGRLLAWGFPQVAAEVA